MIWRIKLLVEWWYWLLFVSIINPPTSLNGTNWSSARIPKKKKFWLMSLNLLSKGRFKVTSVLNQEFLWNQSKVKRFKATCLMSVSKVSFWLKVAWRLMTTSSMSIKSVLSKNELSTQMTHDLLHQSVISEKLKNRLLIFVNFYKTEFSD